ncbi:hypothetical protein Daus18300_011397 [Diaporthe australafricana]|uniref:Uncharacterized protein n=1 Tax=Diaporthe australafricana TaxID=127596 RepID=A0ABR3W6Q6_9PEZI
MAPTEDPKATTGVDDPLEKAEAKKESGQAAPDGLKGEAALDEAIADAGGDDVDPEATSAGDDPLEKAEAAKESS